MAEADAEVRYLAVGANRFPAVADWHEDGLLAFGADNNVCLWNPGNTPSHSQGLRRILSGHTAAVRAVKFLPSTHDDERACLVTGGSDQHLRIWTLDSSKTGPSFAVQDVHAHGASVDCIATSPSPRGQPRRIFVSGAADGTVKIWALTDDQLSSLQTINTSSKYLPLALALAPLGNDGKCWILAVAGTTNVIQIFVASSDGNDVDFKLQATLSGHENWIRSLAITHETKGGEGDLILASASQDKYIRLWRIHEGTALTAPTVASSAMPEASLVPGNKMHRIKTRSASYCVMFEALLLGHEDWIYSTRWNRTPSGKLQLLSSSADNSLSIWEADEDTGIWITTARLGEVSKEKGATTATGSIGGFWTGLWSPSGRTVVTLGRTGSWRRWDYNEAEDRWVQNIAVTGHTRAVTGLAWSRDGTLLLSTSSDQTTRLHAEWKSCGNKSWHEMARPQIHGYDLNCIDTLGNTGFVSGADEKLMRVFTEPKGVAKMLARLTGMEASETELAVLPDAAQMPVLGLSNKGVDAVDDDFDATALVASGPRDFSSTDDRAAVDPTNLVHKSALAVDHPPFEDSLSRHTLWPEVEKLYGHGYELWRLATSHDGRLVASASKASSVNHAVIRVFETATWTEIKPPLAVHTLTVARLRFSADDSLLLSVGRDRQWAVFRRDVEGFRLLQANPKAHARMLLDAAWAPPAERLLQPALFATAGRDKQVKLWVRNLDGQFDLARAVDADHPVTAVDFLPRTTVHGCLVLAMGMEDGQIRLATIRVDGEDVHMVCTLNVAADLCPQKSIMQLAWRPCPADDGVERQENRNELAIAGEDGTLRIYAFTLSRSVLT